MSALSAGGRLASARVNLLEQPLHDASKLRFAQQSVAVPIKSANFFLANSSRRAVRSVRSPPRGLESQAPLRVHRLLEAQRLGRRRIWNVGRRRGRRGRAGSFPAKFEIRPPPRGPRAFSAARRGRPSRDPSRAERRRARPTTPLSDRARGASPAGGGARVARGSQVPRPARAPPTAVARPIPGGPSAAGRYVSESGTRDSGDARADPAPADEARRTRRRSAAIGPRLHHPPRPLRVGDPSLKSAVKRQFQVVESRAHVLRVVHVTGGREVVRSSLRRSCRGRSRARLRQRGPGPRRRAPTDRDGSPPRPFAEDGLAVGVKRPSSTPSKILRASRASHRAPACSAHLRLNELLRPLAPPGCACGAA